ncbi:hypothetical protein [Streptomyces sp. NPDC055749]
MTPGTDSDKRRSRTAQLFGSAALLLLVGLLAAAGLVIYVFEFALPGHREEIEADERKNVRQQIDRTATGLEEAARDGELTDLEIGETAPRHWTVRRGPDRIEVVARFDGGAPAGCRVFTLPVPLGPSTTVRTSEVMGSCPEVTAHPGTS